jgi:glutamate N-acetyltransferase/amino-acid N-acetyltransferase
MTVPGVIEVTGGITAPRGYRAAGIHCGVKRVKKDLAVVLSDLSAATAAVFTTNRVPAAPVIVDRIQLSQNDRMRAIVVNSGNANAATGERGNRDAWAMVRAAASALHVEEGEVLVSSTGVIGQFLPVERVTEGITRVAAALSPSGHSDAAEAICTTDTFTKELAVETEIDGVTVRLGGMAKGSGMIAPNMATMLAFVSSDAAITPEALRAALRVANDRSFHRISVDGDTSTNDMVIVLANGAAGNSEIAGESDAGWPVFASALERLLVRLAKMIVADGEGATKFIDITVRGAAGEPEAVRAARAIAGSMLVKTAIHGEDANWGRILAAVGASGIDFDPARVEILFDDLPVLRQNFVIDFSEDRAREILARKEIPITVDLHRGSESASFWTCDLSKAYVDINASYRT